MKNPLKMQKTFDEKNHRRKLLRLPHYDYSQNGAYFITICTKDRAHAFGKIENGKMIKNELGKIAEEEFLKTQEMRENTVIDSFVLMPNHVHAIVIINNSVGAYCNTPLQTIQTNNVSLQKRTFTSPKNNLGSVVRGFKTAVTTRAKKLGFLHFSWQRNYYEHIIRNEKSFEKISEYIQYNPKKWEDDMFFIDF